MKKGIILLALLFLSFIAVAQEEKNSITTYYGIEKSAMIEYTRYFNEDRGQVVGADIGIGRSFDAETNLKTSIGFRGLVLQPSEWNLIYKMGLVFYDFKSYDVFVGIGVEKNKFHVIGKLNMMQTIGFNGEWAEIGIGFSF